MLDEALGGAEFHRWQLLKSVYTNILAKYRSAEYENEIEELQKSFRQLGAQISVKLHFLQSHLDYFQRNCGDLREEQGERFH